MIKLFIIIFLSSIYTLSASSPSFSLRTPYGEPLELIELKMKAIAEGPYKEMQYILTYKNLQDHAVESIFNFSRSENIIFHKFEATFHNQIIVGKVTAREDNHTELQPSEFVNITVGKLQAHETVQILFSVIQPLPIILNKFYEVKFPAINNTEHSIFHPQDAVNLTQWSLQVEIKANKPLTILSNPTHGFKPDQSNFTNSNITHYKAAWNVTIPTDKDFVVYFAPERLAELELMFAAHPDDPNDQVLLLNVVPDLRDFNDSVAQNTLENHGLLPLEKEAFKQNIYSSPPQYVFMIDRSDSMKGARFETLKRTLIELLQVLPERDEVDFLSFGSTFELYIIKNKHPYADGSPYVSEAIEYIKTLEADMGPKDLLKAMKYVANDYNWGMMYYQTVILLTDGEVTNLDEITPILSKELRYVRTCALGIGNEIPKNIIRDIGNAGGCWSESIAENEDLGEKAFRLIQGSVGIWGFDYNLKFGCQNHQGDVLNEIHLEEEPIEVEQPFNQWIYLDNTSDLKSCEMKFFYFHENRDSFSPEEEIEITSFENSKITDFYHKIAYHEGILSKQRKYNRGSENYEQLRKEKLIQYQILSDFTTLVPVLQETKKADEKKTIQSFDL